MRVLSQIPLRNHDSSEGRNQPSSPTAIILVGGLPGTGKTFFALRLSEKLSATYINSDLMRKEMALQGRYAFEDKLNVYEEMAKSAGKELRQGRSVVVDATFYSKQMREMFATLARLMHLKFVFIEVVADEAVVLKRFRSRKARTAKDLSIHNLVKSQYERPEIDHLVIESKDDNIDDMLGEAMDYITRCARES